MTHPPTDAPHREQLRSAGLRVTRPRLAVLQALEARPHARADEVIDLARQAVNVSTQAVYDVLNTFTDRGLARRIQPAGSVARYELRSASDHHHLVCRACANVVDTDTRTDTSTNTGSGSGTCLTDHDLGPQASGFEVDRAEVIFWGLCPTCQPSSQPSSRPSSRTGHISAPTTIGSDA